MWRKLAQTRYIPLPSIQESNFFVMTTQDPQALASLVRNSPLFDDQWYRQEYPAIEYHSDGNPDPAFHYANYGYKDKCLPSVLFDGNKYSAFNQLTDVNPLVHYLENGARGDYRLLARLPEIITKANLGLDLLPCEKIYYLEHLYNSNIKQNYSLGTQQPVTINEKLLYLLAFGTGKTAEEQEAFTNRALSLMDYTKLPQRLQELGASEDDIKACQKPDLVAKSVSEIEPSRLPRSFRLKFNGYNGEQVFSFNSSQGQIKTMLERAVIDEKKAEQYLKFNVLNPLSKLEPQVQVYNLNPLKSVAGDIAPHKVELWCFNGKVAYSLHYDANHNVAIYDNDGNLQPTNIFTLQGNYIVGDVARDPCHDKLVHLAELCAKDFDFLSVSFLATEDKFVIDGVELYPHQCIFNCTNDFSLRTATKLQMNSCK